MYSMTLQEAIDEMVGFCRACKDFTTECCEPDARRYECDDCGEPQVFGAEEAMMMGLVGVEAM